MKHNRRQVLKAGLAASTVFSPWTLGIAQSKPVKISGVGVANSPTSGAYPEGADDALGYINDNGGINGRKLEVVPTEDIAGNPANGPAALGRLLAREPDILFLGGDSGPLTLALAAELKQLMMPYTSPAYLKALANPQNFPSVFLTGPTFDEMMLAVLQGIKQQKSGASIAIVHTAAPFGSDALPAFKEQAAKDGLKIVLDEVAPPVLNEAAVAPIVPKLLQANADFVVLQGYNMTGEAVLLKAARAGGVKSVFAGTYWSSDVGLVQQAGAAAADGFMVANQSILHTENVGAMEIIRKVRSSRGKDSSYLSNNYLYAWRNLVMYAEALRRAEAAAKLTRAGVVEAMLSLGNVNTGGLYRDLKFVNNRLPYTKLYRLNAAAQKFEPMGDWINFS